MSSKKAKTKKKSGEENSCQENDNGPDENCDQAC